MKKIIILISIILITSCQKCVECTTETRVRTLSGKLLESKKQNALVFGRKQINYYDKKGTKEIQGEYIIETYTICN